jgi:hypothetical protein
MPWTHDCEVATVERGELGFASPFDDRKNGRVHESDPLIGVRRHQLTDALVVRGDQRLDAQCAGLDVVQYPLHRFRSEVSSEEVVEFDKYRSRHYARRSSVREQLGAAGVMRISLIDRG